MTDLFDQTTEPAWLLTEHGYDPLRQSSRETRQTVSNGFLGVRGAAALTRGSGAAAPGRTFIAGLFDTMPGGSSPSVRVPGPDWLRVRLTCGGEPVAHDPGAGSDHKMVLDMRHGQVSTACRHPTADGLQLDLKSLRIVSLKQRRIGFQALQIKVEGGATELTLEANFEGLDLGFCEETQEQNLGVWRTRASRKTLAIASRAWLTVDGRTVDAEALGPFHWRWTVKALEGHLIDFRRIVAVVRDDEIVSTARASREARVELAAACARGPETLVTEHIATWDERWSSSDVVIEGDPAAQQALRFALYHLNSAANPDDGTVSIGARALTGDDYQGHTFWDTEIFLLPFYTFTWPEAARALLMYRFHGLGAARAKATSMGWSGALYAWESADSGEETTPAQWIGPDRRVVTILTGTLEQHVSADIAYAVWQYWLATGDVDFLCDAGAEILLETGRFWASRVSIEPDRRGHIRNVIGPDEYHEGVDDNAYTNAMARWNIRHALETAALLAKRWPMVWARLSARLAITDEALATWEDVASSLATGLDAESQLFAQFDGYLDLEDIDLAAYAGRSVPMDVVLGRDRIAQSQVLKQADVVALLALLPETVSPEILEANFAYYEPRCGHGSSLSRAMHGVVAARLGQAEKALTYLRQSSDIDLADTHVAIAGGIHIAAQGGVWMIAILGLAGLSLREDGLALEPRLPAAWHSLAFPVQWQGRQLRVLIDPVNSRLEARLEAGSPMGLWVEGHRHVLEPGPPLCIALSASPHDCEMAG
ncbi:MULTISPECIES: glycoside hydrolase family 65 protein [unclassified Caulobacter]|uniref:glycoside hydrolase family 65 protein n=1 Tax=unclassified Caulobacter TaxID=2648921 RepID=UPI000D37C792|nr:MULTISPECIES: glycosyl hydrolase family 65 protein [unclassified Caulobacter]PTS83222.1 glycoside hydrolase family 65 protein [Caulobacter sp. HMWF009]PTT06665.1 glycoside hydrolase family 65 protein [Caulobacter sp. HMWF025]